MIFILNEEIYLIFFIQIINLCIFTITIGDNGKE